MTEPYRTIVADCPWQFGDKLPGPGRGAEKHYGVLDLDALKAFPLPPIADDALLFFWRVAAMQEEALAVMRAWGFVPKSEIVWVKLSKDGVMRGVDPFTGNGLAFGMGRYVRHCHEVCLIGRRGRGKVKNRAVRSVFFAPLGRHSAKPEAFFDLVESLADGPYLEVFARRRRPGWDAIGNELPDLSTDALCIECGMVHEGACA